MTSSPTPFERLLRLEQLVSDLQAQHSSPPLPVVDDSSLPKRHLWSADELLLTRLIRRNPVALKAYEAPAELIQTEEQGVVLKATAQSSPFRFCELSSGDAVVWLTAEHESWLYTTDIFRSIFTVPTTSEKEAFLVLQSLPRFIRKVQGQEWTIERLGEMIPKARPFVEQAEQADFEQRLQRLEQAFARMRGGLDAELSVLRSHVQILQDQLDRLLKLNVDIPTN